MLLHKHTPGQANIHEVEGETVKRGGQPYVEKEHAKQLLESGAERIWGWGTPAGEDRVRTHVKCISETLTLRPGTRLLECGCGTGTFTRQLVRSGALITAVDISLDLLKTARRNCSDTNVTFVEANIECPEGRAYHGFDAIYGISLLRHLDFRKALVGLRSLLKPGGRWAFSEPNILNLINKYVVFSPEEDRRRRFGTSPSELAFPPEELRIEF